VIAPISVVACAFVGVVMFALFIRQSRRQARAAHGGGAIFGLVYVALAFILPVTAKRGISH
jgi:threonine/homoserine efflux transporter RhtA